MKKILVVLLVMFFGAQAAVYGQSAYQLVKLSRRVKFKPKPMGQINQHMRVPLASSSLALHVAKLRHPTALESFEKERIFKTKQGEVTVPEIHLVSSFPTPILRDPSTLWGSYHYLRVLTSMSRERGAVHPDYAEQWKYIFYVGSYNGVHHIVNKSTLKEIYFEMKKEAAAKGEPFTVRLDEMQRDAPGSLHPYHGNPQYSVLFHNINRQMELYRRGGIREIVRDYFKELQRYHEKNPQEAPFIPQQVIHNTLLEAKLWSETFHLRWK